MSWDIHYVHILTHVSFHNSVSMRNDPTAFGNIHFAKQLISLEFSSLFSQNCSQCVTEAFTKCLCFHCTFITPSQRFFASQMFTLLQKRREKKEVKKVPKWNVGNEKVLEVETILRLLFGNMQMMSMEGKRTEEKELRDEARKINMQIYSFNQNLNML